MADRPGEFALIERYLAPLAAACPGALSLADDAAVLPISGGHELVVTKDAVVAGVHFLEDEAADVVAARALRVNLSDLAAMGARPTVYFMALALPAEVDEVWIAAFAKQLAADQKTYGITLAGGDTVSTPGPLTVSITALGEVPAGAALTRAGAQPGDRIYVSGTIGDAGLGLAAIKGASGDPSEEAVQVAIARHRFPEPRLGLGAALVGVASAAIDISDGLVADLGHICDASRCGAEIRADLVPLSAAVHARVAAESAGLADALTSGDDYELLFTAPPAAAGRVEAAARKAGIAIAEIGRVTETAGVSVQAADGAPLDLGAGGYTHF